MGGYAIVNQVLVLFLLMLVGFYGRKKKIINNETSKGMSDVLVNITAPMNVIASFSFQFSEQMLKNAGIIFLFAVCAHMIIYWLGNLFFYRIKDDRKNILKFILIFSNCGFMGYPVLESLYGKTGVFYASIYVAVFNLFLWTLGVALFVGKEEKLGWKKLISNPGIVSVGIGLLLFLFSIKLPFSVQRTLELVGGMTTPIAMIVTGTSIAEINLREIFVGKVIYYTSFIRLIFIPVVVFIVLRFLGLRGILLGVCTLTTAMPGAAMTTVFAEKYEYNKSFASQCVFITTLLSLLTIPLMMSLL